MRNVPVNQVSKKCAHNWVDKRVEGGGGEGEEGEEEVKIDRVVIVR